MSDASDRSEYVVVTRATTATAYSVQTLRYNRRDTADTVAEWLRNGGSDDTVRVDTLVLSDPPKAGQCGEGVADVSGGAVTFDVIVRERS